MLNQDYKYPLTRVCLREGQMTLPRRLWDVFPDEGDINAVDSETGEYVTLHMANARTVQGLGGFYKKHHLDVNDKLLIRIQEAGDITLTALRKARQSDYSRPETLANMLNYLAENNTPLSEAEIRDIFPDLPATLDLGALLKEDGRFSRREGRWRLAEEVTKPREPLPIKIDEEVIANPFPFAEDEKFAIPKTSDPLPHQRPIIRGSEWRKQHKVEDDASPAVDGIDNVLGLPLSETDSAAPRANAGTAHQSSPTPLDSNSAHDVARTDYTASVPDSGSSELPTALHSFNFQDVVQSTNLTQSVRTDTHSSTHTNTPVENASVDTTDIRVSAATEQPSDVQTGEPHTETNQNVEQPHGTATHVTPPVFVVEPEAAEAHHDDVLQKIVFPGDVNIRSLAEDEPHEVEQSLSQRIMWLLSQVGYTLEPLNTLNDAKETQQFIARAPLGVNAYSVLIHLHPSNARLDWAGLLAKRRETAVDYLSVFGDVEDLQRLHSPAELARATLWSWKGVERLEGASQALSLSPLDLQDYFAQYGLFEYGLEHFQKATEARISERGYFSMVLRQLARVDAPCTFSLEQLHAETELEPSVLLDIMHTLSNIPFELVVKLDDDQYSLRQSVAHTLTTLRDYADSLSVYIAKQGKEDIVAPRALQANDTQANDTQVNDTQDDAYSGDTRAEELAAV